MTIERIEQNLITGKVLRREELAIGSRERFSFWRQVIVLGNNEVQVNERDGSGVIYFANEINLKANIGTLRFFPPRLIYLEWTPDTPERFF